LALLLPSNNKKQKQLALEIICRKPKKKLALEICRKQKTLLWSFFAEKKQS